ncbi:MAG: peroxide stress protein YaaA [Desulforhopalus sp.]|nr:peroxide stress protein YaaA [Desulforhopalus sp.]
MILITSPSKTQGVVLPPLPKAYSTLTIPQLLGKSKILSAELKKLTPAELSRLMKLSERLSQPTFQRVQSFSTPFTAENAAPALLTFQGDAWGEIDAVHYSAAEIRHASDILCILSGLYGVLRPLDLMQPYRLEMALKLTPQGVKNLYEFWRDSVTEILLQHLAAGDRTLVNLASTEYSRVVDRKRLQMEGCRFVTILFQQPDKKGKKGWKTIPIYTKRARGMMIHHAIREGITTVEKLQEFSAGGYHFMKEESSQEEWLFRLQN